MIVIRGFGSGKDCKIGDFKKLLLQLMSLCCKRQNASWSIGIGLVSFGGRMILTLFKKKKKIGKSGGLLLIWDTKEFMAEESMIDDFFIAVKGRWKGRDVESIIVNVYGPHKDTNKLKLWASLGNFVGNHDVVWFLGGDFNEVRDVSGRKNCIYNDGRSSWFNDFINELRLLDIPLGGKRFTRICDNGLKFSKLDRFLVSEKSIHVWGNLSTLALERKLSNHCPLILRDKEIDFGPKPTKIFDEWLDADGSGDIVKKAWGLNVEGRRLDCIIRKKLKNVKCALKEWSAKSLGKLDDEINELKNSASKWESIAEIRTLNDSERENWLNIRKKWIEKERIKTNMA
ncbi:uncharacterized protein [Rutidosis leptorrhynchoides]|uniref:uncharacterized protein n=1 Tax=Rutidosis leptorrhynchoides TaxID=125765 RepID=UPI003A9A5034